MSSRARLAPALLALATLAVACGDGADPGARGPMVTVDTVDGVERLRYAASAGTDLGWVPDALFVLGDAFAEEAYQFNEVSPDGLAADPDGNLLVLDRQGKRLLRYGPDGSHMDTFGREGEGPGELQQPLGIAVGAGDTVWVSDFSNSRLTGYPLAGGEPRSLPFPENAGFPSPRMAATADGLILQFRAMFNFRRGAGGGMTMSRGDGADEERPVLPLVRFDAATLQPRDTLWRTPEPPTDMVELEMGDRVFITMMSREFHPDFLWDAFSDGGVVVSDTAAYLLRLLAADGTVERIIERDPAPRTITEADREAVRSRLREESEEGGGIRIGGGGPGPDAQARMLEQRLQKMTFAEVAPRVVSLRVDPLDRIWVGISEDEPGEAARIDIYDREGTLVGELRGFPMPHVFLDDDRIGVLRRDDLDVQQVVVSRGARPGMARE